MRVTSTTRRLNRPEQLLRSCLLHTEALPAGIFAKTFTDPDEATPTNVRDPFLLPNSSLINEPPRPIVIVESDSSTKRIITPSHQRKLSDGSSSQLTDDEDDKSSSLHVLTDEQLEHLACVYHPLPVVPATVPSTTSTSATLSESLLNSLSQPFSKLLHR